MIETREKVRRTFSGFLGPVVEAGVPFAATYGNHDFQCGILADEQDDIYREYPGCLNPDDSLEPGTFALPVESSDGSGRVAMSVMMVNSGDYAGKPEENDAQYPAYVVNPRGLDLADADGYGTPTPRPSNGWAPSKPSWASAMATASPCRPSPSSTFRRRNSTIV